MSPEVVARGFEIGLSLAQVLARPIAEALADGLDEQEATRRALEQLAAQPDLTPVLPRVRAMIVHARLPREDREP